MGFREAASLCVWGWSVEFCSQFCLRTSLGPRLWHHHRQVALATAKIVASRAPSKVFLGAGHPHQGSEPPLAQGPTSLLASRLLLPHIRSLAAPLQMQQRLLLRARSDPFPARDGGCATPLTAKENPFLASASSSCILEHVHECITTRSLTDIPLLEVWLPGPLPLHGQLLRGGRVSLGHASQDRAGSSARARASSTLGAWWPEAAGSVLSPGTLHCPTLAAPVPTTRCLKVPGTAGLL